MGKLPNLRSIFASARTSDEEKQLSRATFYRFAVFVGSCVFISLLASKSNSSARDTRRAVSSAVTQVFTDGGLKLV
ncbi:hypothetical protein HD553DRAFT_340226 [Filobasidium floriforme]|uniref:uncharacterized protein n=1 Tax=Filobasidium floriforme TaxID=5210 RepID=UPI001E8CA2A2|nr:uncharacterized protein HD553DRAFT_340226 [Filobasidium floriforme]KAH8088109.1 hypothetical protein HD553DRAFT_340226 [Filobasidium floriforme]